MPDLATFWNDARELDEPRPRPSTAASGEADFHRTLCAEAPRLRRLVHRLLGFTASAGDLDDVVQDALLAACRHRDGFRGEARLSTWLTRIALRKAHDFARRERLRRRLFAWLPGGRAEHLADPPAGAEGPDERLLPARLALQQLDHKDREVLVLRYLEDRPIVAIAELLGCTRAAIDARLSRARQRLRARLDDPGAAT